MLKCLECLSSYWIKVYNKRATRFVCSGMRERSTLSPGACMPIPGAPRPSRTLTNGATNDASPAPRDIGSMASITGVPSARFTSFNFARSVALPGVGAIGGYLSANRMSLVVPGRFRATIDRIWSSMRASCSGYSARMSPIARASLVIAAERVSASPEYVLRS